MELIDRAKVIEKLAKIRDSRRKSCSRQAMTEASAMEYAIEIVKKIPAEAEREDGN